MEVERSKDSLVVHLTAEEVFAIQAGKTVGERGGLLPDSKVEIIPLKKIAPDDSNKDQWTDDRLEMARKAPLIACVFSNQDVQIAIPEIVLSDVRVAGRNIPNGEIVLFDENARHVLPSEGIRITFGGSLQVVDVLRNYYPTS